MKIFVVPCWVFSAVCKFVSKIGSGVTGWRSAGNEFSGLDQIQQFLDMITETTRNNCISILSQILDELSETVEMTSFSLLFDR